MPVIILRAPPKELAGGHAALEVAGASVGEALRALEVAWPRTTGYVLDEHGRIRRHVNVFLRLFFGATLGEVFGSLDPGPTWFRAAEHLAPVTSVRIA